MFHATPGKLPAADARELAGIALPPGRLVTAEEGDGGPVAWISNALLPTDEIDELIRDLAAVFDKTGLWPLRANGLDDGDLARPWFDGELDGKSAGSAIPQDALTVLTRGDAEFAAEYPDTQLSVPRVTALATAQSGPDPVAGELATGGDGGLLLVPVVRPADAPEVLGWWGATNIDYSGADLAAVLRSWEERFGAVLVGIGFDTLLVQVGRRPEAAAQLQSLLSEHYAFCPDNIEQGLEPDEYREGLTEWTHWHFWWD
ncbi:DUF4253 domain-containing protein [Nocardiopsis tropica]|uniref:DUF4253 domain-containing protein n=1 Tax=Tsukamurella strandjordii TaxID=147577 RepID=UPI0031D7A9EA